MNAKRTDIKLQKRKKKVNSETHYYHYSKSMAWNCKNEVYYGRGIVFFYLFILSSRKSKCAFVGDEETAVHDRHSAHKL